MKPSDREFIAEVEDILNEAGRVLVELQDSGGNPDHINALFRACHTIKGLSGLFGHQGITGVSHSLESLLDDARLGKVNFTQDLVGFLFTGLDFIKKAIEDVEGGGKEDFDAFLKEIEDFRRAGLSGRKVEVRLEGLIEASILKVLSEYEEHRLKANINEGRGIYLLKKVFPMNTFESRLEEDIKIVKSAGELISTLPTADGVPAGQIGFNLLFSSAGKTSLEDLKGIFPPSELEELLPPAVAPASAEAGKANAASWKPEVSMKSSSTTVRVDIEKLDRILNTIGELTLTKTAIRRIADELTERFGYSALVMDVYKVNQALERRLQDLQQQVLEIRMVPIGQIFSRLSQVVKRVSREAGKQIGLLMYGEDTEIDKYLAEEVIDPLVHIIRNAVDHGIESAEERQAAGKDPSGTITLKAFQRGNYVVIEAGDDGRGIQVEKIRLKALEKGLIEKGAVMQRRELIDLIFTPGFSTTDEVSEISGRGVGLDIVREKLSALGGFSDIETEDGKGSRFIITLPVTLAIIKALVVGAGGEQFAIPLTSISETQAIEESSIQSVEGRLVYNLRGDMLPIARIGKVFGLPAENPGRGYAVIVGFGERRMGLVVDELFGQQEVVIKSLGDYFKGLRGFAGAAEIGKHEVILVVDVESVIEESLTRQKGPLRV